MHSRRTLWSAGPVISKSSSNSRRNRPTTGMLKKTNPLGYFICASLGAKSLNHREEALVGAATHRRGSQARPAYRACHRLKRAASLVLNPLRLAFNACSRCLKAKKETRIEIPAPSKKPHACLPARKLRHGLQGADKHRAKCSLENRGFGVHKRHQLVVLRKQTKTNSASKLTTRNQPPIRSVFPRSREVFE